MLPEGPGVVDMFCRILTAIDDDVISLDISRCATREGTLPYASALAYPKAIHCFWLGSHWLCLACFCGLLQCCSALPSSYHFGWSQSGVIACALQMVQDTFVWTCIHWRIAVVSDTVEKHESPCVHVAHHKLEGMKQRCCYVQDSGRDQAQHAAQRCHARDMPARFGRSLV